MIKNPVTNKSKQNGKIMRKQCVLFVDDEEMTVKLGKEMLEDLGYIVTGQTCCQKALKIFMNNPTRFDLVITDYDMPKMNGSQFADRLRTIRRNIPILLSTGHKYITSDTVKSWKIDGIIKKPYQSEELDVLIKRVLKT